MIDDYKIVVSGDKWLDYGAITTSRAITELIEGSKESLVLTIYIINNEDILQKIRDALIRNVIIDIYMYKMENKHQWAYTIIEDLDKEFSNLHVFVSTDEFIHAKVLIADGQSTLIGSANLTPSALSTNYELGIQLNSEEIAWDVNKIIKNLIK